SADVGDVDGRRSASEASPIGAWCGPLGVLLTLAAIVVVVRAVRRGRLPPAAAVLSVAPVLWIALIGLAVPYSEWNGRYAMAGFALGAATWPVVLRPRPLAFAAITVAALTTVLSFVHLHDKPSGLRLIESTSERSGWSLPDWAVQATDHPNQRALYRFVERSMPSRTRLDLQPVRFPWNRNVGGLVP